MNPDNLPGPFGVEDTEEWLSTERIMVVGTSYRDESFDQLNNRGLIGRDPETMYLSANLVREPDNPYDPEAIAVYIGQIHVGYIPREATDSLIGFFTQDRNALFVAARLVTAFDGRWRVEMEISIDEIFEWSKSENRPVSIK